MTDQAYTEPTVDTHRARTGWVGWIYFAAVLMILAGVLNAIHGLVAIVNDQWVVFGNSNNLYLDLTQWGWIHLVIGVLLALAGVGVLSGNLLARIVGVVIACVSVIANFLYMAAYPVWSLTVIALDIFVIYALTAHGAEMRDDG